MVRCGNQIKAIHSKHVSFEVNVEPWAHFHIYQQDSPGQKFSPGVYLCQALVKWRFCAKSCEPKPPAEPMMLWRTNITVVPWGFKTWKTDVMSTGSWWIYEKNMQKVMVDRKDMKATSLDLVHDFMIFHVNFPLHILFIHSTNALNLLPSL